MSSELDKLDPEAYEGKDRRWFYYSLSRKLYDYARKQEARIAEVEEALDDQRRGWDEALAEHLKGPEARLEKADALADAVEARFPDRETRFELEAPLTAYRESGPTEQETE